MKQLTFFELRVDTDTNEGKGPTKVHACFTNKGDAVTVCNDPEFWRKYGVWNTKIDSQFAVREKNITVYESVEEYKEKHDTVTLKQQALNKLTPAERKVLGLE